MEKNKEKCELPSDSSLALTVLLNSNLIVHYKTVDEKLWLSDVSTKKVNKSVTTGTVTQQQKWHFSALFKWFISNCLKSLFGMQQGVPQAMF